MCGGAKAKTQIAEIPETQIAEIGGANAKTQIAGSHVSATPQVLRTCGGAGTRDSRPGDSERGVVGGGVWGDLPPASSSAGRDMSRILDEMVLLLGYLATPTSTGGASVFAGWRNGVMMVRDEREEGRGAVGGVWGESGWCGCVPEAPKGDRLSLKMRSVPFC